MIICALSSLTKISPNSFLSIPSLFKTVPNIFACVKRSNLLGRQFLARKVQNQRILAQNNQDTVELVHIQFQETADCSCRRCRWLMLAPLKSFLDGDLQRVLKKENKNLLPFLSILLLINKRRIILRKVLINHLIHRKITKSRINCSPRK